MKFLFPIILFFSFAAVRAQTAASDLMTCGLNMIWRNHPHPDSALALALKLQKEYPEYQPALTEDLLARCYLQKGDSLRAERYFLKLLSRGSLGDSLQDLRASASNQLADIYFAQQKWRAALDHMHWQLTKYKPQHRMCMGGCGATFKFRDAYREAVCWYNLNAKDSAIAVLGPKIFRPNAFYCWDDDDLSYDTISRFWVNTVFELYGKAAAKAELIKALKMVTYRETIDTKYPTHYLEADCRTRFLGMILHLDENVGYGLEPGQTSIPYVSKEIFVQDLKQSYAYKMIMEQDCEDAGFMGSP